MVCAYFGSDADVCYYGYPNQRIDQVRPAFEAGGANRELRLVKLGGPGETMDDMINGGNCL